VPMLFIGAQYLTKARAIKMINWLLAKLDKYKIKVIRPKFVPDELDKSWAK